MEWYASGGRRGLPLPGQELIDLAFTLHMMPDQILHSDETWIHKMLAAHLARHQAARQLKG